MSLSPKASGPTRCDHRHATAEPAGRARLVGALSAGIEGQVAAGDGFSRAGKTVHGKHQVHIGASDHDDFRSRWLQGETTISRRNGKVGAGVRKGLYFLSKERSMKRITRILTAGLLLSAAVVQGQAADRERRISVKEYLEKMKAGWIGQIVGVSLGRADREQVPDDHAAREGAAVHRGPGQPGVRPGRSLRGDDVPAHAGAVRIRRARSGKPGSISPTVSTGSGSPTPPGRTNLRKGIAPPDSSHPKFHSSASAIDYQIEADYSGLIAPGMLNIPSQLGEKFGRLMNYGDGVYAGQFMGCMYAEAFFETEHRQDHRSRAQVHPRREHVRRNGARHAEVALREPEELGKDLGTGGRRSTATTRTTT